MDPRVKRGGDSVRVARVDFHASRSTDSVLGSVGAREDCAITAPHNAIGRCVHSHRCARSLARDLRVEWVEQADEKQFPNRD